MLFAGLRRSEVTALRLADYAPHSGVLVVRRGKDNASRSLTLPTPARDTLRRWRARRGAAGGALVFRVYPRIDPTSSLSTQWLYTIVQERSRLAGLPACSPHDLRRTFVTRLLERGIDLNTVRQLAWHRGIHTTALYDHRSESTQRRALRALAFCSNVYDGSRTVCRIAG